MSILIKGLKMPKKGTCIDIVIFDDGTVVYYDDDKKIGEAVELPDHGDLIDRDVVADALDVMAVYGRLRDAFDMVMSCEAVIPAERSEASLCDNCDERSDVGCSWCKRTERSEE